MTVGAGDATVTPDDAKSDVKVSKATERGLNWAATEDPGARPRKGGFTAFSTLTRDEGKPARSGPKYRHTHGRRSAAGRRDSP